MPEATAAIPEERDHQAYATMHDKDSLGAI